MPNRYSEAPRLLPRFAVPGMAAAAPVRAMLALAAAAVAALLAPASGAAQQADPYRVMEAASERFEGIGTLCADFHQSLSVPLLDQTKEGRGHMCQRGSNLFSMRFTEPTGDVVVVDGSHLWVYYPSQDKNQVFKAPLAGLGVGIDFQREFLEAPKDKYTATMEGPETVGGKATWRILLKPKADAPYRDATVWVGRDDRLLHKLEIREENGSVRIVNLSGIEVDPSVGADIFTFTPPAGAQIVTR